jgi:hypothetical protein
MKNFEEFSDLIKILEDFNFSFDVKWNEFEGYFEDNLGIRYKIEAINLTNNEWMFKFYRWDDKKDEFLSSLNPIDKSLKSNQSSNVLGTIRKSFVYFIEKYNPSSVSFIATDKSESRKDLYDLFSEWIIKEKEEYNNISYVNKEFKLYIIYKNKESIKNIIEMINSKFNILF